MFLFLHAISHFHLTPSHLSRQAFAATNHLTAHWKRIHHFCVYKQQRQRRRQRLALQPGWNTSLEINAGISIMQRIGGELAWQINAVQFKPFNCQPFLSPAAEMRTPNLLSTSGNVRNKATFYRVNAQIFLFLS